MNKVFFHISYTKNKIFLISGKLYPPLQKIVYREYIDDDMRVDDSDVTASARK